MKLVENTRLLFEVESLVHTSPSTISRCGMIFVGKDILKWQSIIDRWLILCRIQILKMQPNEVNSLSSKANRYL